METQQSTNQNQAFGKLANWPKIKTIKFFLALNPKYKEFSETNFFLWKFPENFFTIRESMKEESLRKFEIANLQKFTIEKITAQFRHYSQCLLRTHKKRK